MSSVETTSTSTRRNAHVATPKNFETIAWLGMRYSAILLIPLAFGHIILQDVIVGVHQIDLSYVDLRWEMIAWRLYDGALLAFAFAHGMNGLRQVLMDYIHSERLFRAVSWALLAIWFLISALGFVALFGGVRN
jgi:succinate dehydrogenase / fumarate reductase membrane anchor subunit